MAFFCRPGRAIGMLFIIVSLILLGPSSASPKLFASLFCKEFFLGTLKYPQVILGIMIISIGFANLGSGAISALIHPAIVTCYPAIIVLTICNIIHKIYGFNMIKSPVYSAFFTSAAAKSIHLLGLQNSPFPPLLKSLTFRSL